MKQYIVEFSERLNVQKKEEILHSIGAKRIGSIFMNFELISCSEEIAKELKQNKNIISVEENEYCEIQDAESPIFPIHFINILNNAHEKGYKGDGVVIAIIDTGFNYEHEDLQLPLFKCARILNDSVISVDVLEDIKDLHGHGTRVASVIAMQDNGKGYVGIAPNVELLIIKATESDGSMSYASQAKAITWAVENGADIINISFHQPTFNSGVNAACQYAYGNNVSVTAIAGNNGNNFTFTGDLSADNNVSFWKEYKGVVVAGAVKMKESWSGKLLPEFPITFNQYANSLIYYNAANKRYRIILSDHPITIERHQVGEFLILVKGYLEAYDLFPETSLKWLIHRTRQSENFEGMWFATGSPYPDFLYTNHAVINNKEGGIIHTSQIDMDVFRTHVINNFGHLLPDYEDTLQNVIKAPFSSFGQGIDFVAPGYFSLAEGDVNNGYRIGWGTSYSAPYVAGIIAIVKQRFPHFTIDDIYSYLRNYAVNVGDGRTEHYGNGLITVPDLSLDYILKFYYEDKENKMIKPLVI